jgi:YD repeat-containing protein
LPERNKITVSVIFFDNETASIFTQENLLGRGNSKMRIGKVLAALSFSAVMLGVVAQAAEIINYAYDANGRLVRVNRSGTVNNGIATTYQHDKADNRANLTVTGSPNTINNPPTTVNNTLSLQRCTVRTVNVLTNDSDPEGNIPLTLTAVSPAFSARGDATFQANGVVSFSATSVGSVVLTYTVSDSLGATANGSLTGC